MTENPIRKIIHIDMDAFYASVEQRDNPAFRGKPLAVGGSAERGVVAAASYEARKFGVKSAMASKIAIRKCPQLIFTKPRFEVYKLVSSQIRAIFEEYTAMVEPLSLDEAYLDVTENLQGKNTATEIAQEIKEKIKEKTGLTASAGVSYNKFLSKLASDYKKPDGLFVIKPGRGEAFVESLDIGTFHGIGKVTAQKMNGFGVFTGMDLKLKSEEFLNKNFGKMGNYYFNIARGIDHRPVSADRIRKSVGSENTFDRDLDTLVQLQNGLEPLIKEVWEYLERKNMMGRTLTIKVKFNDFHQVTRSKSFLSPMTAFGVFEKTAYDLLEQVFEQSIKPVRLLGVSVSNLVFEQDLIGKQLTLSF